MRTTIVTSLVPTVATGLRGVPRVNFDHGHTSFLSLVGQEAMELSKAPTMEPTLILGVLLHGGPVSNVCQVLNDKSRARGSV